MIHITILTSVHCGKENLALIAGLTAQCCKNIALPRCLVFQRGFTCETGSTTLGVRVKKMDFVSRGQP